MSQKSKSLDELKLLLLDLIALTIAFFVSFIIRYGWVANYLFWNVYGIAYIGSCLLYILYYLYITKKTKDFFKRGFYEEFISVFQNISVYSLTILALLFLIKKSTIYSRAFFMIFFVAFIFISYIIRLYYKVFLIALYNKQELRNKIIIVTTANYAAATVKRLHSEQPWNVQFTGIVLLDTNMLGLRVDGIKVIADKKTMYDVITKAEVDEVFISLPSFEGADLEHMINELQDMGTTVELSINTFNLKLKEKTIRNFSGFHVLTFSTKVFDYSALAVKRAIDIVGGLIGCVFTILLTLVIAPAILIESPGPVVFSQVRVGKNGRRFRIYKFRSMYRDAEKRKAELMAKNEMKGHMFKITDDPRITKVGNFLRKTSLDEFPQFFNVLKGDMSLVGTRPPTEDEFLQYDGKHKRRLMMKPGITGLWQASGRSDIENFEEVVKMDLEYIDNWSLGFDIKLIVKTVFVVLFRVGAK